MSIQEIVNAMEQGERVFWSNPNYEVKANGNGWYDIVCASNGHRIGLTDRKRKNLNGHPDDFYVQDFKNLV